MWYYSICSISWEYIQYFIFITNIYIDTPWDEPSEQSIEFCAYCSGATAALKQEPWSRLTKHTSKLIRSMLSVYEEKRITMQGIMSNSWFKRDNYMLRDGQCSDPVALAAKLMSCLNVDDQINCSQMNIEDFLSQSMNTKPENINQQQHEEQHHEEQQFAFSQPVQYHGHQFTQSTEDQTMNFAFSQPDTANLFFANSGTTSLLTPDNNNGQQLAPNRLARFYSRHPVHALLTRLQSLLDDFLIQYTLSNTTLHFSTVDRRKCPLNGEVRVQKVSSDVLLVMVVFGKRNGDPLEFKRFFQAARTELRDLICTEAMI